MTLATASESLHRLRRVVARRLGLHVDESRLDLLDELLRERVQATGASAEAYVASLDSGEPPPDEIRKLACKLTVGETFFFRNVDQFRALGETALQARCRIRGPHGPLRIVSAGCASGEEAYSIAVTVLERLGESWARRLELLGVDVNPAAIERARQARYSPWSLRETPPELQAQWFTPLGREFHLAEAIRSMARFEERNLALDDASLWRPAHYDVVFCRNVLMYFAPERARQLVGRIARSLVPGGFLFLGHAETLRGLSQEFHLCHTHGTFYYQRRDGTGPPQDEPCAGIPAGEPAPPELAALVDSATSWVDAIGRASERVQTLSAAGATPTATAAQIGQRSRGDALDVAHALDLLRHERFADALQVLHTVPAHAAADPEVLLLRAALLTHSGGLDAAEAACHRLLEADELSAGAHYLLALCREGQGDRAGSIEHDQIAAYLDPAFAMPRLHLGLLARRTGDAETALRELARARLLLEREEPSRLLLFGGGFGREALIALCIAEERASRGPS